MTDAVANLDYTFVDWLESNVIAYLERADTYADLTMHQVEVLGEEMSQEQALDRLLDWIECYHTLVRAGNGTKDAVLRIIGLTWTAVLPYMWL